MEAEQRTKPRDTMTALRLNRKSYSRVGPLAERLLRTFSEAVFILTRNCSSNLRPLISPSKDRFFSHRATSTR
jgi:hypothetical protein